MRPKVNDYARALSQGKSFNFSTWDALETYSNTNYLQDFVVFDNNIYVCKESVEAGGLNPEEDIQLNGVHDASWQLVLKSDKGFEQWSDSDKQLLIKAFLEVTDVADVINRADEIGKNPPIINPSDGHWYFWNVDTKAYEDSGKSSTGLLINKIGFTREYGELPGYIRENQHYVLGSDKVFDDEGNELKGIGSMQRMDITLNDGTTKRTYIPDGLSITSIRQSHRAQESGEDNIFTVTYNNGARTQLYVRNGMDGMAFKKVDALPVGQPFEDNYNLHNLPNSRYLYLLEDFIPLKINNMDVYLLPTGERLIADPVSGEYSYMGEVIDPVELGYPRVPDPNAEASFSEYLWVENATYLDKNGYPVYKDESNTYYYADTDGNYSIDTSDTKYEAVTGAYDCLGSAKLDLDMYVSYDIQTGYTDAQKLQARTNINAAGDLSSIITVTYNKDTNSFTHSTVSKDGLKSWVSSARRRVRYIEKEGGLDTDKGEFYNFDIVAPEDGTDVFRFEIDGQYLNVKVPQNITNNSIDFDWDTTTAPYVTWVDQSQKESLTDEQKENARVNIDAEWVKLKDRLHNEVDEDGLVITPAKPLDYTAEDDHYVSSENAFDYASSGKMMTVLYNSTDETAAFQYIPTNAILRNFVASPYKSVIFGFDGGELAEKAIAPEYTYFKVNQTGTTVTSREYTYLFHCVDNEAKDRYVEMTVVVPTDKDVDATVTLEPKRTLYVRTDYDQADYLTLIEKATARHNINATPLYSEGWEVSVVGEVAESVTEPIDKHLWMEDPYKLIKVDGSLVTASKQVLAEKCEPNAVSTFEFAKDNMIITATCTLDDLLEVSTEWKVAYIERDLYVVTTTGDDKYLTESAPVVDPATVPDHIITADVLDWFAAEEKKLFINGVEKQFDECLEGGYEALVSEGVDAEGHVWKWVLRIATDGTMAIIDATHEVKVTEQIFDNEEQHIARHNINAKPIYAKNVVKATITESEVVDQVYPDTDVENHLWAESEAKVIFTVDGEEVGEALPTKVNLPLEEIAGAEYSFEYEVGDYSVVYSFELDDDLAITNQVWAATSLCKHLGVKVTSVEDDKYLAVENPEVIELDPANPTHKDCDDPVEWLSAPYKELAIAIDDDAPVDVLFEKVADGYEATIRKELRKDEAGVEMAENLCWWKLHIDFDGTLSIYDAADHDVKFIDEKLDNEEKEIARHNINAAPLYAEGLIKLTIVNDEVDGDVEYPEDEHLWAESEHRTAEITVYGSPVSVEMKAVLPLREEVGAHYKFVGKAGEFIVTYEYDLNDDLLIKEDTKEWTLESTIKELYLNVEFGEDKYYSPVVTLGEGLVEYRKPTSILDWLAAEEKRLYLVVEGIATETPFVELNGYRRALISEGTDLVTNNFWKWMLHINDDGTLEVIDYTHDVKVTPQTFDPDEKKQARENIQAAYNSGITLCTISYDSEADEFTCDKSDPLSIPVETYEDWKACDVKLIKYVKDGVEQYIKITAIGDNKYEFDHNCFFEYEGTDVDAYGNEGGHLVITGSRAYDLPNSAADKQYLASTDNPKIHVWKNYIQNDDPDNTVWEADSIFQYTGEEKASTVDTTVTLKNGGIYKVTTDAAPVEAREFIDLPTATSALALVGGLVTGVKVWSTLDSHLYEYDGLDWQLQPYGYKKDDVFYNGSGVTLYKELYIPSRLPESNAAANEFLFGTDDKDINVWKKYIQQVELPDDAVAGDIYQYIGETTADYIQDHFYRFDGTDWKEVLKYTLKKQAVADEADAVTGEKFYETYTIQVDGVDVADSEKLNIREDKNLVKASLYKATAADAALVDLDGNALVANKHYMKYEFNEASKVAPIYAPHELAVETITDGAVIADDSVLKKYKFTMNDEELITIDILKDLVIESGEVITAVGTEVIETLADGTEVLAEAGKKYLKFTIANQTAPVYIAVSELFDLFTVTPADKIQLAISDTNEITADVVPGSLGSVDFDADTNTRLDFTGYDKTIDVGQPAHYAPCGCTEEGAIKVVVDGHVTTNNEITITNVVNVNTAAHASLDGITVGSCVKYVAEIPAGGKQLKTVSKNLRDAVNELYDDLDAVIGGELNELTTEAKTLINAINELNVTKSVSVTDVPAADLNDGVAKAYDINQENADGTVDKKGTIEIPYSNYDGDTTDTIEVTVHNEDDDRRIEASVVDGSIGRTQLDVDVNEELNYIRSTKDKSTVTDTLNNAVTPAATVNAALNILDKEMGDINTLTVKDIAGAVKKNVADAINELDRKQGDATLTVKDPLGAPLATISEAINELDAKQGDEPLSVYFDGVSYGDDLSKAVNASAAEILKRVRYCGTVTKNEFNAAKTGARKNDLYVLSEGITDNGVQYSAGTWALCTNVDAAADKTWVYINNNVGKANSIKAVTNSEYIIESNDGGVKIVGVKGGLQDDEAGTIYMVSIDGNPPAFKPHHGIYVKTGEPGAANSNDILEIFDFGTDGNAGGGSTYEGLTGANIKVDVNNLTTPGTIGASILAGTLTKGLMDSEINAIFALTGYPTPLTTAATTLAGAVNEHDTEIGDLNDLEVEGKTYNSLVEVANQIANGNMKYIGQANITTTTTSLANLSPVSKGYVYNVVGASGVMINGMEMNNGDWIMALNSTTAGQEPAFIKVGSSSNSAGTVPLIRLY